MKFYFQTRVKINLLVEEVLPFTQRTSLGNLKFNLSSGTAHIDWVRR